MSEVSKTNEVYSENTNLDSDEEIKDEVGLDADVPLTTELESIGTVDTSTLKSKPRALFAVIILTVLNLLNFADRFIPSSTKDMVKKDFDLSDSQTGLFVLAFLVVYMIANPVFGSLVDHGVSRKIIIVVGVVVWSISASSAFFANGFYTFLLSRAGVGIGEAAFISCTVPLFSDLYPPHMRNKVLAFFYASSPVGSAIGFIVGGKLGESLGWRYAYLITGLPGILLAFLVIFIEDPGLGSFEAPMSPTPWMQLLKQLVRNKEYLYATIGITVATFGVGGMADWLPAYFSRTNKDVTMATASFVIGVVTVIGGIGGSASGGFLGDFLRNKKMSNAYFFTSFIGLFLASILSTISLFVGAGFYAKAVLIGFSEIVLFLYTAPTSAITANCVHASVRSRAVGLQTFILHVLGDAVSPLIVGAISDASLSSTCDLACATTHGVMLIPLSFVLASVVFFIGWRFSPETPQIVSSEVEVSRELEDEWDQKSNSLKDK